jgi:hypothetical protein
MGWIGCVRCENFWCDFMARTSALIAPVNPFCSEFRIVTKNCKMHPNTMRCTKTSVYGPIGWIGCIRCEKFRCDVAARTFALIAPVQPVLYRASSSNETIQNAFKHYETLQNMSLGHNGVDWVQSLQKILMRLRGTNFCTNCTSSTSLATNFVQ